MIEIGGTSNINQLGICKGLIMRGDNLGFKTLIDLYKSQNNKENFNDLFGLIIIKKPSKYISKENGFSFLNKMYM